MDLQVGSEPTSLLPNRGKRLTTRPLEHIRIRHLLSLKDVRGLYMQAARNIQLFNTYYALVVILLSKASAERSIY